MKDTINQTPDSPIVEAMRKAYRSGQEEEALEPMVAVDPSGKPLGRIKDGDSVIFYDIRGEREIELTESLTDQDFGHFPIQKNMNLNFVTMIEYHSSLNVQVAFPPEGKLKNTFIEVVTKAGLRLAKVSESEKAIHLGYFMNGRNEGTFPGEERITVPSPQGISNYALTPEMSASAVTDAIFAKIQELSLPVVIANFANVDVVGHIEDKKAIIKAVEAVDQELGRITEKCRELGISLIVTSDHGTVEEWLYPDGTVHTGHTKNPVPFIFADFAVRKPQGWTLEKEGELSDVAPTLLELLGLEKPPEMSGKSLLKDFHGKREIKQKILLLILDGWGMREEEFGNIIAEADTPNFDHLWSRFPHLKLAASGKAVGMPEGTVGNSEAGHLHLGAGRRVFLDRVKIDNSIADGSFFRNEAFCWAIEEAKKKNNALHLLGIVSHYSSHGTIRHLFALLELAQKMKQDRVFVHALIGRRGEKPESGAVYVRKVENKCKSFSLGKVVTVMGRFWALDREENWDRVQKAYDALVLGKGEKIVFDNDAESPF
jgi:2,3-bisphosphoglycerate-independent phosphoglycerate mutase